MTAILAAALLAAAPVPDASAQFLLTIGFSSDPALTAGTTASRAVWIDRAVSEGAGIVRVNVIWSQIAPVTRPRGFNAGNPLSPGYDWSAIDGPVRDLAAHGIQVLLNISAAPAWAEGSHRPRGVQPGTWRPDPQQFASFARAAALRYDGAFPDPSLRRRFRLPFVTDRLDARHVRAWGRAPQAGKLALELRRGDGGTSSGAWRLGRGKCS